MSTGVTARNRDVIAFVGIFVAAPLALYGLMLPFHDYAGMPGLERLVNRDTLFVSTFITVVGFGAAIVPMAAWPSRVLRMVAAAVFLLALWNLVDVLSYYWWRSDLVFCHGGCS